MSLTGSDLEIHLPDLATNPDQDAEWCEIDAPEGRRRIRFHDYADIFAVPGLYERLFYDVLECASPETVAGLLGGVLRERGDDPSELAFLDVGAGNGMVGEELAGLGAGRIAGVDILEEAAAATERDRPGVYDDYFVIDLTDPPAEAHAALSEPGFDALTTVAALGFDDMPPEAFQQAFDYVRPGGVVAYTLKERFTDAEEDESGFAALLRRLRAGGELSPLAEHRYRHRLSVGGEPLHYVAYVAEKAA
jgi:SAM-dependent methyltransferase